MEWTCLTLSMNDSNDSKSPPSHALDNCPRPQTRRVVIIVTSLKEASWAVLLFWTTARAHDNVADSLNASPGFRSNFTDLSSEGLISFVLIAVGSGHDSTCY